MLSQIHKNNLMKTPQKRPKKNQGPPTALKSEMTKTDPKKGQNLFFDSFPFKGDKEKRETYNPKRKKREQNRSHPQGPSRGCLDQPGSTIGCLDQPGATILVGALTHQAQPGYEKGKIVKWEPRATSSHSETRLSFELDWREFRHVETTRLRIREDPIPFVRGFCPSSTTCLLSRANFAHPEAHCSGRDSPEPATRTNHYILKPYQICLVGHNNTFVFKPGPMLKRSNKKGALSKP